MLPDTADGSEDYTTVVKLRLMFAQSFLQYLMRYFINEDILS